MHFWNRLQLAGSKKDEGEFVQTAELVPGINNAMHVHIVMAGQEHYSHKYSVCAQDLARKF